MERRLIVNADDFGMSEGVNCGILRAHRDGIVTSASLLVRYPAAKHAVRNAGRLDLGLHLDFGEWEYRNHEWVARYERASLVDPEQVAAEARSQWNEFLAMTGTEPTHIDSHQHVHRHEPLLSVAKSMAEQWSLPLRGISPRIQYCGDFYGQSGRGEPNAEAVSAEGLIKLLMQLPAGTTELACHPGEDAGLDSRYARERFLEVDALCSPKVRATIAAQRVHLQSFAELLCVGGTTC